MSEFAFLFRAKPPVGSAKQLETHMKNWFAWIDGLGKEKMLKNQGNALDPSGVVVLDKQRKNVSEGPRGADDFVSGFLVIEAKDLEHASRVASSCPIYDTPRNPGFVEVRPLMSFDPKWAGK